MRKITRLLACLSCVAALTLAACDKDETPNPFEGGDNHITSFVLKKDEVSYRAVIAPGTVTVTVPENVSLSGYTAEYRLCENATINPDPATVTDWESEQQFVVTAHNGAKSTYRYTVERSGVVHPGAVILNTQDEVDAFRQGSYTIIDGYLAIGRTSGTDTITSLAPLAGLKTVTGSIIVNVMYMGEDLVFEHLETVGELYVLSKKVKTARFPNLTTVRMNINIEQAASIRTLDFPELTVIDKTLRIYQVDSLATMNFPKLKRVRENINLDVQATSKMNSLQTITFPSLETVDGSFIIVRWQEVTEINLPELVTVGTIFNPGYQPRMERIVAPKLETAGTITVNGAYSPLTTLNFSALKTVNKLYIEYSGSLTSLEGLSALRSVEELYLGYLSGLASLDGLSSIEKIGKLSVVSLASFAEIDLRGGIGIGTLDLQAGSVTPSLTVRGNDEFAGNISLTVLNQHNVRNFPITIDGIKKVGSLSVATYNNPIANLEFAGIEEVAGQLSFSGNISAISLSNLTKAGALQLSPSVLATVNLPKLEEITGYTSGTTTVGGLKFTVSSANLTAVTFPKLRQVEGDISFTGLVAARPLATISFPELESLTGTLTITGTSNTTFKNLSGFSQLTSAAGVTISNFTQLSDFSPLGKVVCSLPDGNAWKITNCGGTPANYTYEAMKNQYCGDE
jgi:hypothetical protein